MRVILIPIFASAAALLLLAGARKLLDPRALLPALGALGLPPWPLTARILGSVEVGLGALALLWPSPAVAAACAAIYALFALALMRLMRAAPEIDCGCFGDDRSHNAAGEVSARGVGGVERVHRVGGGRVLQIALDLIACASCIAAAALPPAGIDAFTQRSPLPAVVLAIGCGGCIYAAYLCFTALPAAFEAYRGGRR